MSTAGEAAALFGSEDSAADPFSLDPLNAETEQVAGQDSFAEQDVQSATDLFGSSTGDDFTFQALSKTQSQASYEYAGTEHTWSAHETQYASNYSDPSQYAATQNAYSQQATTQGYSAQQGQWAGYEPQQYNPPGNVVGKCTRFARSHTHSVSERLVRCLLADVFIPIHAIQHDERLRTPCSGYYDIIRSRIP